MQRSSPGLLWHYHSILRLPRRKDETFMTNHVTLLCCKIDLLMSPYTALPCTGALGCALPIAVTALALQNTPPGISVLWSQGR